MATDTMIRILHLEDHPSDARLVAFELNERAFPCVLTVVSTRGEYCRALAEGSFDVILSDYKLPDIRGDEAFLLARQKFPDIPFLMVTGELGEERAVEAMKQGITDYVLKDRLFRLVPALQRALAEVEDHSKRRQAEEKLRESEQLYRAIGETINYGIWVCDANGKNIYASPSFLALVGQTQQECSEFGWGSVLHPDDADATIAAWKECSRTGSFWERAHRFRGTDGQYHHVLARGIPIRGEDGAIIRWAGINLDIDEIKRTERELRQTQERLALALKHAGVSAFECDLNLRFTWVYNAGMGFQDASTIGKTAAEVAGEAGAAEAMALKREALRTGKPVRKVIRFGDQNGTDRYYDQYVEPLHDAAGAIRGLIGLSLDVTERVLAEQRLRQSEASFRTMVARSQEAMALLDDSGTVLCISTKAAGVLGYGPEEIEGTDARTLVDKADKLSFAMHYQDMRKNAPLPTTATFRLRKKDGGWVWIAATATFENYGQLPEKYLVKFQTLDVPLGRRWTSP